MPYLQCRDIDHNGWSDLLNARLAQVAAPVRAMLVVMHGVLIQDRVQMPSPSNQNAIGDLHPGCAHPAFGIGIRSRATRRDLHHLAPPSANTASNASVNCPARSRITNRNRPTRSPRSMSRFRACCTVHAPSGCAVTPRT
jgi:hypothetical protein